MSRTNFVCFSCSQGTVREREQILEILIMNSFFQICVVTICIAILLIPVGLLNALYNYIVMHSIFGWKCSKKEHKEKVEAVAKQVKIWVDGDRKRKLCSARPGWKSISLNKVDKSNYHQVELGNLNDVVEIDTKNQSLTVEPGMCMGQLSRILVPKGWTIPVVPELDSLTVGGLIAGAGVETSSHKHSMFYNTALSYEVVLPSGEIVTCSNDNDPELFYAIPGSYGTIGFLTAVTFRLIPAKKFVQLEYRLSSSIKSALKTINDEANHHDFVEGIAYAKDKVLIMFGNMVDQPSSSGKINNVNRWYKRFFNIQAEQVMNNLIENGNPNYIEYIPTIGYYHRHTRGYFWLATNVTPGVCRSRLFMALAGWAAPVNIHFQRFIMKWLFNLALSNQIIQDYVVPLEKTEELFNKADELLNIYPVWICPALALKNSTCFQFPDKYDNTLYIDLGFYGNPTKNSKMDKKGMLKYFEKLTIKLNGFQGLYADCFMSRMEFETMFHFKNYNKVRKERKCDAAFPQIYDKICAKARKLEKEMDEKNK